MELEDLTRDERVALVALLEIVVDSATTLTEGEVDQVREIVAEVGEEAYQDAVAEVDRRLRDEDALKQFLTTITRQDARERIYEAVLEAALPDSLNRRESSLLEWLATEWRVSVRVEQ
jgi:hypothetical protein